MSAPIKLVQRLVWSLVLLFLPDIGVRAEAIGSGLELSFGLAPSSIENPGLHFLAGASPSVEHPFPNFGVYHRERIGRAFLWGMILPGLYLGVSVLLKELAFPDAYRTNPLLYVNAFALGFAAAGLVTAVFAQTGGFLGGLRDAGVIVVLGILGGTAATVWLGTRDSYIPVAYYTPPVFWLSVGTIVFGYRIYEGLSSYGN